MTLSQDRPRRRFGRALTDRVVSGARRISRGVRRPRPRIEHPVCHDLASWAQSHPGAERSVLDPSFTISRRLPMTIEPTLDPVFARLSSFEVPERALVKIPDARIRGQVGFVILPGGEFVGEVVALTPDGQQRLLREEDAYTDPLPAHTETRRGNYYAVLGLGYDHYYHWSHDLVMRMRGIGDALPSDTQLIVPETMRPFQIETLALLGLDAHPRVPFPRSACWRLEHLYVVTPLLKAQIDSEEPYRWFRDRAMRRYGVAPGSPTRRLYLTRRHDNHWRTTNEREVEAYLAGQGFETIAPGAMSFGEQVRLFSEAEIIVGAGAGLFNMTFAPPDSKVLQLQETSHTELALWMMADAMNIEYHYVMCDAVANTEHANSDLHVPIDKLAAALEHLLASPGPASRPGT